MRLILGSQSPRRKQLLTQAGFTFEVRVSAVPEDYPADMPLAQVASYLAEKKANALLPTLQTGEVLVCADSVVICNGEFLGKPENFEDAVNILQKLSNNTHEVITGVCIIQTNKKQVFAESTFVTFKPLTLQEIHHYLHTEQPYDKAGSYGIQDWIGCIGISRIEGCFYNVMGLPISKVYQALKEIESEN